MTDRLYLVSLKECDACKEAKAQLASEEGIRVLEEKLGTHEFEVIYGDGEGEQGDLARNLAYSLDRFSAPMLTKVTVEEGKPKKVCLLGDDLEEKKCAPVRNLPRD